MSKFQPGVSGNPVGRPVGVGKAAALRRSLERKAGKVQAMVLAKALAGDLAAAKMVLDRVVPLLRAIDQPVHVPDAGTEPGDQARAVVTAAIVGAIAPAQAAELLTAAAHGMRVIESIEFEKRIARLEERAGLLAEPASAAPAAPAPTNGHDRDRH